MTHPHQEPVAMRSTWAITPRGAYDVGLSFEPKEDMMNALTIGGGRQHSALAERAGSHLEERRVVFVSREEGAVEASLAAKTVCQEVGMSRTAALDVIEVVEKLTQHIRECASCGTISFSPLHGPLAGIEIRSQDGGTDVEKLKVLLAETIYARTGTGHHALADEFSITTGSAGNHVRFVKYA